jgi:glycosyltransferase involved in cell wall biosynthesis
VLLEALARRPELKLRLLVYGGPDGDGHYFDGLKALADADPRVELMGTFPAGEMGRVLANAAALALPALWYENEPLVVKAALYAGVPVLASDIGTLADSVGRSPAGRLVPAGDVRAWAAALAAVCAGPLLSRAPDRSIKSMDENARELLAIYREVLSNE